MDGWFTMIEENLAARFPTAVLGAPVAVEGVDVNRREQITASASAVGSGSRTRSSISRSAQPQRRAPLPQFIEQLYFKRFGRERPELVMSVEERARTTEARRAARKEARRRARAGSGAPPGQAP